MSLHEHPIRAAATPASAVHIRPAVPADADAIGRVSYAAFSTLQERHGFTCDFPSLEAATGLARAQIADPRTFGVVATVDGAVVGSNFLSEGDPVRGVGPVSVDPDRQDLGIGRALMQAVIDRGGDTLGVRLVQDAFNAKTMALYTALGFDAREPLAVVAGKPRDPASTDGRARLMAPGDLRAAAALCRRVHGFTRTVELQAALAQGAPVALERAGRISAYMAHPGLWLMNHAVAEDEETLQALILGAGALAEQPLAFLLPIRRARLLRWCLDQGLRVVKPMTLMSRGHYSDPDGAWLPSVFY